MVVGRRWRPNGGGWCWWPTALGGGSERGPDAQLGFWVWLGYFFPPVERDWQKKE